VARAEENARKLPASLDRASFRTKAGGYKEAPEERKAFSMCSFTALSFSMTGLQYLDALRALRRLRIHKETYRSFFKLVGTNDIPGLHRILKISERWNWSLEKLLDKARKALDGYHPKNFSDVEFDLATAIYDLGGGSTLCPSKLTIRIPSQNDTH
jgi:hypothetical protein